MTIFSPQPNPSQNGPAFSPSHGLGEVDVYGPLFPINADCRYCNLTAQGIAWVRLKWIAAGIDKGE